MSEPKAIVFVVDDDVSVRESFRESDSVGGVGSRDLCLCAGVFGTPAAGCAELSGLRCTAAGTERARSAEADG